MTREEKLMAMEELWADLSRDADKIASPAWHAAALDEAEQSIRAGTASFCNLDEVKARFRSLAG